MKHSIFHANVLIVDTHIQLKKKIRKKIKKTETVNIKIIYWAENSSQSLKGSLFLGYIII